MSDAKQPLVDSYQMGKIVTVNEARQERGLGPLKNADGTDSDDGKLTIDQYNDKQYAERAAARGYGPVPSAASTVSPSATRLPFKNLR